MLNKLNYNVLIRLISSNTFVLFYSFWNLIVDVLTKNVQVYKLEELQMIADLCIKHDLLCFSDEVYEWLTYDGAKHVKIGKKDTDKSADVLKNLSMFSNGGFCL